MAEETVQILFRGSPQFRKRLQQAALNRGIKVQQLLEEAVEDYLAKDSRGNSDGLSALGSPEDHLSSAELESQTRSGNVSSIEAVLQLVEQGFRNFARTRAAMEQLRVDTIQPPNSDGQLGTASVLQVPSITTESRDRDSTAPAQFQEFTENVLTSGEVSLHRLLTDILRSGNETFIRGISANLEAWGLVVRASAGGGTGEESVRVAASEDDDSDARLIAQAQRALEYARQDHPGDERQAGGDSASAPRRRRG